MPPNFFPIPLQARLVHRPDPVSDCGIGQILSITPRSARLRANTADPAPQAGASRDVNMVLVMFPNWLGRIGAAFPSLWGKPDPG